MHEEANQNRQIFLQTPDLAEKLGVSIRTIERWRYDGLIPFKKIGRRVVLHRLDDVLKALKVFDNPAHTKTPDIQQEAK
jgi:excisionase family DNA binding protein